MNRKARQRFVFVLLASFALFTTVFALAASNSVPITHLTDQSSFITVNDIKPAACGGLTLTAIFYCPEGGGNCNSTDASELVIGSPAPDNIQGGKGDDCILGGGGIDNIRGEQGTDVCIGGNGNDSFHPSCETRIQ
jgi:Ca2+-binding RTX toxin-like protein